MGFRSVIFGHIHLSRGGHDDYNRRALAEFPFDKVYPFPNIFYLPERSGYKGLSIFIGGAFKQIEDEWQEWFSRFTQFLSVLEATEANIVLDCFYGRFAWTLSPEILACGGTASDIPTFVGQTWYIIQAPTQDGGFEEVLRPMNTPTHIEANHLHGC